MKKPLVSVIIPAYNEELVIENLLASIKAQTYKNIEVILVDDGSQDKTVAIAKKYAKVFARKHAERSVQRNFGAKKSKGEILIFLDADMMLSPKVVEDVVSKMTKSSNKCLVIPEKTAGKGFIPKIRRFEREMYEGDQTIEVARVFDRKVFFDFNGYDEKLTGPEDYDLPYRIAKIHKTGRGKEYLFHRETRLTFRKLMAKRYYYAQKGALYAQKHPELVMSQGNLIFRAAYFKNWKKFFKHPFLGLSFIFIKACEAVSAILGYISAVGIGGFTKTLLLSLKSEK